MMMRSSRRLDSSSFPIMRMVVSVSNYISLPVCMWSCCDSHRPSIKDIAICAYLCMYCVHIQQKGFNNKQVRVRNTDTCSYSRNKRPFGRRQASTLVVKAYWNVMRTSNKPGGGSEYMSAGRQ
eukprot:scaffold155503_cov19-Prasinocladus_malaysianus.AAC.1